MLDPYVHARGWLVDFDTTPIIVTFLQAAREETLTREMYVAARESVRERSDFWGVRLGVLAIVAFYGTIGLVVAIHSPELADPYYNNKFKLDMVSRFY